MENPSINGWFRGTLVQPQRRENGMPRSDPFAVHRAIGLKVLEWADDLEDGDCETAGWWF